MQNNPFVRAQAYRRPAKVAIFGPSGAGKTYTSLVLATRMAEREEGRVALIDTEHGSASLYADRFDFDMVALEPPYHPDVYTELIRLAEENGYPVIVIDSLSHAWSGPGGALDQLDIHKGKYGGNRWAAWADVTPMHLRLVETILSVKAHVIFTMRAKTRWEVQREGDQVRPVKIGLDPVQRDGIEYEPDITAWMDLDHVLHVDKTRLAALDGKVFPSPGPEVADLILDSLPKGDGKGPWTETVREIQTRVAPESVPTQKVGSEAALIFWRRARELGIPREEAREILGQAGSVELALKELEDRSREAE